MNIGFEPTTMVRIPILCIILTLSKMRWRSLNLFRCQSLNFQNSRLGPKHYSSVILVQSIVNRTWLADMALAPRPRDTASLEQVGRWPCGKAVPRGQHRGKATSTNQVLFTAYWTKMTPEQCLGT